MKPLQKILRVNREEFFKMHLSIINTLAKDEEKMVNKEMEVLAAFLSLDKSITDEDMFNTLARKQVKVKLGNMSAGGLGNHLKSLIEKNHLYKNEITGRITVNPAIIPEEPIQGYQIKLWILTPLPNQENV